MKRSSNLYTILYATILVLAVGFTLALVYQVLQPMQIENISNDKRRQILAAAHIFSTPDKSIPELYSEYIIDSYIVNSKGEKINSDLSAFEVNVSEEYKKPGDERLLPVFVCKTKSGNKYILPVYGAGLWGPIWGYMAFDDNGDTVYGAYFAHQGETPGLGAEIEKSAFTSQFEGKNIFSEKGKFTSIMVVKAGREPADGVPYVNAVSGGTVTSTGVQNMLFNSLEPYNAFLRKIAVSSVN